ncbi:MAG: hypothetical protein NTU44_11505 [Bacteroidetes bacterium]|nr:hypothetical protein [Bacteroidota bacterium]
MTLKKFFIYIGNHHQDRLRFRFETLKDEVVDLVVQYEAFIGNQWQAIVRYDCDHGFFHRDILSPNGDKEKKAFDLYDLNSGLQFARTDLEDRWEWYKEQFIKKNKDAK